MSKLKLATLWIFIIGFSTSLFCLMLSDKNDIAGWFLASFYSFMCVYYATKELTNKND